MERDGKEMRGEGRDGEGRRKRKEGKGGERKGEKGGNDRKLPSIAQLPLAKVFVREFTSCLYHRNSCPS